MLDFNRERLVGADMKYYIQAMKDEFPEEIKSAKRTPWNDSLLKIKSNFY